jgi:small subunit ribosomal protein S8
MLTRIRNALLAKHERVEMPLSNLKRAIAEILVAEGYIRGFEVKDGHPAMLTLELKYTRDRSSAILGLRRSSRPGRRVYVRHRDLPTVRGGLGISIISTSHGLLTNRQASEQRLGGEVLCEVW